MELKVSTKSTAARQQILTAFGQVSESFQHLVNAWTTIVESLSIHKRLETFEAAFEGHDPTVLERAIVREGELHET